MPSSGRTKRPCPKAERATWSRNPLGGQHDPRGRPQRGRHRRSHHLGPPARLPRLRTHPAGEALMSTAGWLQFAVPGLIVVISTPLLGKYIYLGLRVAVAPGAPTLPPDYK